MSNWRPQRELSCGVRYARQALRLRLLAYKCARSSEAPVALARDFVHSSDLASNLPRSGQLREGCAAIPICGLIKIDGQTFDFKKAAPLARSPNALAELTDKRSRDC